MLDGQDKQEIIIIKRGGGDGDGHHGGAWKIAFADFMTAMMALFLVLWLVNAANEETKKSVASYFNPVKLVDRNRSVKGLLDPKTGGGEDESKESGSSKKRDDIGSETKINGGFGDSELFQDPFRVLDEIAAGAEVELASSNSGVEESAGHNRQEDAFADPFAPQAVRAKLPQNEAADKPKIVDEGTGKTAKTARDGKQKKPKSPVEHSALKTEPAGPSNSSEETDQDKEAGETPKSDEADKTAPQIAEKKMKLAADISNEISERLSNVLGRTEQLSESLSVRLTESGVLISITDQLGFSMFQVGSAVPKGQLVLAMKEISDILSTKPGGVRIHGHTDGQPYAKGSYDNWNLSTARAHSARFMLVRGGFPDSRISRVIGFADRDLIDQAAPESPANRRIEILLEVQ